MLVTDDDALASRARSMSLHGISRDAWNRYTASGSWYYEIEDAGYKYNMTDVAAALGLVQLDRADELLNARKELAAMYGALLVERHLDGLLELPADASDGSHAWHLYIVRLALDRLAVDRGQVDRPAQGPWHRNECPLHSASSPPLLPPSVELQAQRPAESPRPSTSERFHSPSGLGCPLPTSSASWTA